MSDFVKDIEHYLNSFENKQEEVAEVLRILNELEVTFKTNPSAHNISKLQGVLNIAMVDLNLFSTSFLSIVNILVPELSSQSFSGKIKPIIDGYYQIAQSKVDHIEQNKSAYLDYILVAAGDLRSLLIAMVFNIYDIRTLNANSPSFDHILTHAKEIFIPLCHRLGFYRLKSELEDLVFKHSDPQIYNELQDKISQTAKERDQFIKQFIMPITKELDEHKLDYKIKYRTKSVTSIFAKMQNQKIPFERVYDLFAIRIITNSPITREKIDCWHAFSVVTNSYKSDIKRLRDWISKPRENGYESLHITVETPESRFVEVQIRSARMDDEAENGMAAHWRYKGGKSDDTVNNYLLKIRKAIESRNQDEHVFDAKASTTDLYVFTPTGELKKLHSGATVLDFAFSIHSEVGVRCSGARINGILKPIKHQLANGDRVEIITSRNQKPTLDWLNIVASNKAKNRIRKAVDEAKLKEAEEGKEILLRRLRNWKLDFNQEVLDEIASYFKTKNITDIYRDIFREKLDMTLLKKVLSHRLDHTVKLDEPEIIDKKTLAKSSNDDLVIDETDQLNYKLAACCHPVPGDAIFGFVTVSKGITIHRSDCPNAKSMFDRYAYRIIPAKWKNKEDQTKFRAEIFLKGLDRNGVLSDITKVVNGQASLLQVNISSIGNYFQGKITVGIHDKQQIGALINSLNAMKDIIEVYRIGG